MSNLLDWSTCKLGCLHGTLFAASGSLLANYSKLASSKAQPYKLPVGLVWLAASFFPRTLTLNSILFRFSPSEKKIQMWACEKKNPNVGLGRPALSTTFQYVASRAHMVRRSSVGFDLPTPSGFDPGSPWSTVQSSQQQRSKRSWNLNLSMCKVWLLSCSDLCSCHIGNSET